YSDFGGEITTIARNPINQSRQRKKGAVTDLEASGGFQQDLTFFNTRNLLQGFMFADFREKKTTAPTNGVNYAVTAVDAATNTFTVAAGGGAGFVAGQLIATEGFINPVNNGAKTVVSATGTTIVVAETLVDELAPPAAAKLVVVGLTAAVGDLSLAPAGGYANLVSAGGTDFTTLGLIPGEWVYVGGDGATSAFDDNGGFARIGAISAGTLTFDKV